MSLLQLGNHYHFQEALVEYISNERLIQSYDECLDNIRDAKELIGDKRREIQFGLDVQEIEYRYNRSNPFYPSLRALEMLNGYTRHIRDLNKLADMSKRVERAAHHIEELAGFARKLVNLLILRKADWKTERTAQILTSLCDEIDDFALTFVPYTRYQNEKYKGGGAYLDIVKNHTSYIRSKL